MYRIIGNDQKEYGPVSYEDLRQWIRENRANATTRVRPDGTMDWRPLSSFSEFADLLAVPQTPPPVYPAAPQPASYYYPRQAGNGMATTGLVFSLIGFFCCCLPLFPLLGLVFGIIGLLNYSRNPLRGGKAVAIIAIILSILELAFWFIMFLVALTGNNHSVNFNYPI